MSNVTVGVFGATGLTGRRVVSHALEHGHAVRALARNPSKLGIEHPDLSVIEGDFENVAALQQTVAGTTHVICCGGGTYGKGYDTGMMTRFVERLWPILDVESTLRAFLFQSVIFATDLDGSNPLLLRATAPLAARVNGSTDMLNDNNAVTAFMAANESDSFDFVITRPGRIADKDARSALVASPTPSFASITFSDLGAFNLAAVQDASLYGSAPFVAPKK